MILYSLVLLAIIACTANNKSIIYLDWFADDLRNDKLFSLVDGGKEWQLLKTKLAMQQIHLTTIPYRSSSDPDRSKTLHRITHFDMPSDSHAFARRYGARAVVFLWEPPSVKPQNFNRFLHADIATIFTWADDLIDNQRFFKFFYPQPSSVTSIPVEYDQRRFCCCFVGNKHSEHPQELYSERFKTILFFEEHAPHLFDLYGSGWQSVRVHGKSLSCYKGFAAHKYDVLRRYKFCICYENIRDIQGYISEKIHHCLLVGTVPIYWGAANVTDYIPANCFIDRRLFASNAELYDYLVNLTPEEYAAYTAAASRYLTSKQQLLFSNLYFVHSLLRGLVAGYDKRTFFSEDECALLEYLDAWQQDIIQRAHS